MPTWPGSRASSGSFRPESVLVRTIKSNPSSLLLLTQTGEHRVVLERGRVADRILAARDVAQQTAHDLSAARLRQRVGEAEIVRAREGADLLRDVLAECLPELLGRALARLERHEGGDRLALQLVRPADDRGLGDGGMGHARAPHPPPP